MIEVLRDPMWQFIGGVLAIATTFLIYYLQRQSKSLSYEILAKNRLLTINEELEGRIKILFDNKPTSDISLLSIKIFNSGNIAIPTSDYEHPISLSLGVKTSILSGTITNISPKNLKVKIQIENNHVLITPCLLNATDSITIKLLMTDFNNEIEFDARIVGVKEIRNATNKATKFDIATSILIIAILLIPPYYLITRNFIGIVLSSSTMMMKISGFSILLAVISFYLLALFAAYNNIMRRFANNF